MQHRNTERRALECCRSPEAAAADLADPASVRGTYPPKLKTERSQDAAGADCTNLSDAGGTIRLPKHGLKTPSG